MGQPAFCETGAGATDRHAFIARELNRRAIAEHAVTRAK